MGSGLPKPATATSTSIVAMYLKLIGSRLNLSCISRRLFFSLCSRSLLTSPVHCSGICSNHYHISRGNALQIKGCSQISHSRPHRQIDLNFYSQSLSTDISHGQSADGTLTTDWVEHGFSEVAEGTLELISEKVSAIGFDSSNAPDNFDVDLSQGVLTIQIGDMGTYVLNTQTPNRQIWMSSPISGPWRYGWHPVHQEWISSRDGHYLSTRLSNELGEIFGKPVTISFSPVSVANSNHITN